MTPPPGAPAGDAEELLWRVCASCGDSFAITRAESDDLARCGLDLPQSCPPCEAAALDAAPDRQDVDDDLDG